MRQTEIQIGDTYHAKVSGKTARVKITATQQNHKGRTYWLGRNIATGREITIRGAARLHAITTPLPRWLLLIDDGRRVATRAADAAAAEAKAVALGHVVHSVTLMPARAPTLDEQIAVALHREA